MADNSQNIELIRKGFEAFASADMATLTELIHEDAVWHSYPGKSEISGDFKGRDDTFAMFTKMFTLSEGTVKVSADDIAASGDYVYVLVSNSATRNGQTRESSGVMRFHVVDGKTKEAWVYGSDPAVDDAFWS